VLCRDWKNNLKYHDTTGVFYNSQLWWLYCNHLVRPSVRLSVRSHFRNRYLSFYWKKWFYIWYLALAWWIVPCLPFPGLPHIYFLFTLRLTNERVGVFLSQISNIKSFLPVEAEISVTKVWTDGQTDRRTDKVIAI
jgi:hypothetical protein